MPPLSGFSQSKSLVLSLFVDNRQFEGLASMDAILSDARPGSDLSTIVFGQSGSTLYGVYKAVDTILSIVSQANGDSTVQGSSKDGTVSAKTGRGDDTIELRAEAVGRVSSGAGDDTVDIMTRAGNSPSEKSPPLDSIYGVYSGRGDDTISIDSDGSVDLVDSGEGDDRISIDHAYPSGSPGAPRDRLTVTRVLAGAGDDSVSIKTEGDVFAVDGGSGNDEIDIVANSVAAVEGGDGADTIRIDAEAAFGVMGGDGDDEIYIKGSGSFINGGAGNDRIVFEGKGNMKYASSVVVGQGHDLIETDEAIVLHGLTDKSDFFDLSRLTFSRISADTVTIAIDGGEASVSVRFNGPMKETEELEFEMDSAGGLLIRSAGDTIQSSFKKSFSFNRETLTVEEHLPERVVLQMPTTITRNV
ncbi:hypothetical protein U0C82_01930 [Fulvimarina sp. 2208YS6-2-32]|uniref:Calcium-binding protein n=1 Tax=Fulvimarina uroteuthidis TaxID=3098149 RepID=A0ABU5HXP6_9HYPH|nr:hypothetical protein [Fulvimarina sp. 2208YS6-2-32]MDY8107908.1 hypothetical protein [Fulvimarina sp. 2208YS6-2-32]